MKLSEFLTADSILTGVRPTSKKHALQAVAARAAAVKGLDEQSVMTTLLEREKLGSTKIGHGVAIPHGKLPELNEITGFLACLDEPVEFDAAAKETVDLLFVLLAPEDKEAEQLKALEIAARRLRDPSLISGIRARKDAASILAFVKRGEAEQAQGARRE